MRSDSTALHCKNRGRSLIQGSVVSVGADAEMRLDPAPPTEVVAAIVHIPARCRTKTLEPLASCLRSGWHDRMKRSARSVDLRRS
jgi:hypothetical protein